MPETKARSNRSSSSIARIKSGVCSSRLELNPLQDLKQKQVAGFEKRHRASLPALNFCGAVRN
jgi:hypothetical protein